MASVATVLEQAFPKPTEASTSDAPPVKTPTLGPISGEETEFSNMIEEAAVTSSPLTIAVMECLYGPYSHKKSQTIGANAAATPLGRKPKLLAESSIGMDEGSEAKDPFGPLVLEEEMISNSILIDILNEEGEDFLAEIEMVRLFSLEFWGTKGQLKGL